MCKKEGVFSRAYGNSTVCSETQTENEILFCDYIHKVHVVMYYGYVWQSRVESNIILFHIPCTMSSTFVYDIEERSGEVPSLSLSWGVG